MRSAIAPIRTRRSIRPTACRTLPVSQLPVSPTARRSRHREAGSRRRAAGSANADADLLVVPRPAGTDRRTPRSPSATSDRTDITNSSASTPTNRFPVICPASPCPGELSEQLPRRHRRHARSRRNLLRPDRDQGQSRARQHLDLFLRRRQLLQRAAGGPEPSLQPRLLAARRLHLVEDDRRWRFAERHDLGRRTRAGFESLRPARRQGLANFDVRNVGVINASYALPFGKHSRTTLLTQRLDRQLDRHAARRFPVHAAAQLQPVEQRRHAESGAAVRESGVHRPGDSGQSESVVQSGRVSRAAERQRLLRKSGPRHADRPRPRHLGFLGAEGHADSRATAICSSARSSSMS